MSFKKEQRYTVIKLKHLNDQQKEELQSLIDTFDLPPIECVCIESDWDCYDAAWDLVKEEASTPTSKDFCTK